MGSKVNYIWGIREHKIDLEITYHHRRTSEGNHEVPNVTITIEIDPKLQTGMIMFMAIDG
jgi:hypothetical protein